MRSNRYLRPDSHHRHQAQQARHEGALSHRQSPDCIRNVQQLRLPPWAVGLRIDRHLEILALRHQVAVLNRSRSPRLRLTAVDRLLWAWLSQAWTEWRSALVLVKSDTVLAWHPRGFRLFWAWKSRHRTGRPATAPEVRARIRRMATANPLWGAPRIHGNC